MKATVGGTVAAVLLLVTMGGARAECAWVLWRTITSAGQPEAWEVLRGFGSRTECVVGLRAEANRFSAVTEGLGEVLKSGVNLRRWNEDLAGGAIVTEVSREGKHLHFHEVRCLPDTVDPRGPKGK